VSETLAQRELRWARERERQRAWREQPEQVAARAARIAAGDCFFEGNQCVTHHVPDSLAHHFDVYPDAYND
jgi:hypothetical protein